MVGILLCSPTAVFPSINSYSRRNSCTTIRIAEATSPNFALATCAERNASSDLENVAFRIAILCSRLLLIASASNRRRSSAWCATHAAVRLSHAQRVAASRQLVGALVARGLPFLSCALLHALYALSKEASAPKAR